MGKRQQIKAARRRARRWAALQANRAFLIWLTTPIQIQVGMNVSPLLFLQF